MKVVRQMLAMAALQEGETLFDLGAGDGRVIINAAVTYSSRAVGVEIDPLKCLLLRARISFMGLGDSVGVLKSDFFKADLSKADVVFLYLSPAAHDRLREKLNKELREGSRVVCYRRPIPGWSAEAVNLSHDLYLYRIGRAPSESVVHTM